MSDEHHPWARLSFPDIVATTSRILWRRWWTVMRITSCRSSTSSLLCQGVMLRTSSDACIASSNSWKLRYQLDLTALFTGDHNMEEKVAELAVLPHDFYVNKAFGKTRFELCVGCSSPLSR